MGVVGLILEYKASEKRGKNREGVKGVGRGGAGYGGGSFGLRATARGIQNVYSMAPL